MRSVEVAAVEDADGVGLLLRQAAKEADEARLVFNLELGTGGHLD